MRHLSVMALVMVLGPVSAGVGMPTSIPPPTDLGSLGGSPFPVNFGGFSQNGTVVGGTVKVGIGQVPFVWTAAEGLHVIASQIGSASGANDIGQVVGYFSPPSAPTTGFIWTDSNPPTRVAITNPNASSVTPHFVNHSGLVAGEMDLNNGERHAFTWTASGGLKDIGWLGGSQLWVTGITGNGLVIGYAENASGNTHAFSWKSGSSLKDLGTLGGLWSYASGANDSGKIVGYSQDTSFQTQAFVYQNGKMTLLASPSGTGLAFAVNTGGTVVGSSLSGSALVWSPTGQATAIPGVDYAVDINDNGQVAAYLFSGYNQEPRSFFWSAATGLVDAGSEDDYSSQAMGITNDGRIVSQRVDWSNVTKVYVWKSATSRSLLDGLGGGYSRALKVNSAGQVAGVSRTALGYNRAFIWSSSSGMVEVPAPLHSHSTPVAINSTGQILGSTYTGTTIQTSGSSFFWPGTGTAFSDLGVVSVADLNDSSQVLGYVNGGAAFVWANGTSTIIPAAPGVQVIPVDINNKGQVVGYYYPTAFATHAFSWQFGAAAIVDLGTLGGSNSRAVAVNENGQITGTAALTGDTASHAFRMTAGGTMKDLGSNFGATGNSTAVAINKGGAVTGQDAGGQDFHGFLYDTRLHDLGDLGGVDNQIWGINDLKDVVGWRLDLMTGPVAIVFPGGGTMTDLPPLAGQDSSQAFDVNNAGQVIGNASMPDGQRRALLWDTR